MHATLLLQLQQRMLANALARAGASAPIGLPILMIGAASLLVYECASLYASLADCSVCVASVHAHRRAATAIWLTLCLLITIAAGTLAKRHLSALAMSAWLAPLPWPDLARRRALRLTGAVYGTAWALALATITFAAAHAVGVTTTPLLAAATGVMSAASFAAAIWRAPAASRHNRAARPTAARKPWLLEPIDRARPTHASRWAMAGRTRFVVLAWLTGLLALGPAAAAASLAQHQAAIALGIAVVGAHAVFVLALRCQPLQAAALRVTPLGFAPAAAAMCRAPLALSLAWFALAAILPCASGRAAWPLLPAMIAALLLCNALYAAAAMARPTAPGQAILLYAAGVYATGFEAASSGLPYGALTLLAVCAVAALLARQARRRYRAFHG